jgi:hypothetical protein
VKANQDTYPVGVMCRLLKVSTSGFYDWRDRPMSLHDRRDVELAALMHAVYERSHRTYGARRVRAEFREAYDVRVGRKRVARLMRGGPTFSDTGISGFLSGHDRREVHAKAET